MTRERLHVNLSAKGACNESNISTARDFRFNFHFDCGNHFTVRHPFNRFCYACGYYARSLRRLVHYGYAILVASTASNASLDYSFWHSNDTDLDYAITNFGLVSSCHVGYLRGTIGRNHIAFLGATLVMHVKSCWVFMPTAVIVLDSSISWSAQ